MYFGGPGSTFGALWGSSGVIFAHFGALEGICGACGAQLGKFIQQSPAIGHIWHPTGSLWDSFWVL